jgi:hypothetical protein
LADLSGNNPDQYSANARAAEGSPVVSNDSLLVDWCVTRATRARQARDQIYGDRWKEYTRLWRGFWQSNDAQYKSERSRLISPALSQAIEMTVSEIEEALFGREAWLDISDDYEDQERDDVTVLRDRALEDIDECKGQIAMSHTFLMGAIYGTGITKIHVEVARQNRMTSDGLVFLGEKVKVPFEAVRPDEFFIDPSATTIDEAQYVGHDVIRPLHTVKEKMKGDKPIYKNVSLDPYSGLKGDSMGNGMTSSVQATDDAVLITEYYGKVPARYIPGAKGSVVEAIVTIANNATLLRAIVSPFWMQDRPFAAYQHDSVPGEFWGRGVAEKGYNPQKALDTELRARADALALITSPMMGADMTRIGKNPDMRVMPGKFLFTRGRPSEIFEPIGFSPQGLALTFQQTGDLERQVQMGTGAMDSATPLGTNRRNETASGMSMLQASFLKRAKRTMKNIENQYMNVLITRMLWRYMQFDPGRYPKDFKFKIRAAMGIMAREVENAQLVSMLGYTPPESPAHSIILKALFENTASADKKELKEAIAAIMQPPSPEQQQMQQQMQQLALRKAQAEVAKLEADAQLSQAKAQHEMINASLEDDKIEIEAAYAATGAENARISRDKHDHERVYDQHDIALRHREVDVKEKVANKPAPKASK